ncbi:TonB-dependent receptor plug domain-containing protein [Microbulbifer celer]|uniref:TonB-dependent receptor plug domain-containing protein n=1 Tax=Microbulbifer celer TaxID=435905 RepID=A0ABW3U646_9GAMM|nr:TonB-dependent receptor [Microbulbifer celer]UFN56699.1 TonB-dependent receptor [Microbulbifer celer]
MKRKTLSYAVLAMITGGALAPVQPAMAEEEIEEVAVTGVRGKPRSVSDSPVPVDVFGSEALESVSYTDTNDVMKTLVPSYNVNRQPISDGGTFVRPAQLRGMPTDKTLVLVNSKRRHRAALVQIGGSGTQGPDIATIPSSALKSVEVLRDGAAAQYGSDAIAGVINFILKDNAEGGSVSVRAGEYTEGDGFQTTATGNVGMPIGNDGFFSISGEVSQSDFTSRSEQYCESWFCIDEQSPEFIAAAENASLEGDVVQPWGQPNTEGSRLFFNAGYDLGGGKEIYAFGNYSESSADGGFYYRYPGNGTIEDLRKQDGSIYSPLEKFPGGFTPRFAGEVTDYSLASGLKGETLSGVLYDFSARYGYSDIDYTLKNTINPSMGPASPTSFRPGTLANEEVQLQADFSKALELGMHAPVVAAFGLSYMDESYELTGGDEASYAAGPYATPDPWGFCDGAVPTAAGQTVIDSGSSLNCADENDPVYTVVGVGSNGFPGYSPEYSGSYSRDSYAIYGDLSTDVTDRLFVQGAMRFEDYSDFDSELVGKLAMQYDLTENIGLRSSVGTGFRAPTPGQQGTTNVSTRLPNGFPVATGLFPATSPVAQALGAEALKPETSINYTFGFTADFDALSMTVDFYRIDVDDRTYAISTLDVSAETDSGAAYDNYLALVDAGVVGAESIGGVFYFTNAFDTRTQGVDVVATYPLSWSDTSVTNLTASFNYNKSEFASDPSEYLNEEDEFDFENFQPELRGAVTALHDIGPVSIMARANWYGSYENFEAGDTQEYDPVIQVDLEGRYHITEMTNVSIGGRNIFDKYPEMDQLGDECCGAIYMAGTIVDWQGSFYYMSLNHNF